MTTFARLHELPLRPEAPPAPRSEDALWGPGPGLRPYGLDPGEGPAPGSVPVSVTVLTRNQEAGLPGCLASVAFAAEVVVVDGQSTDRTAALAEEAGAQVYVRPWPGFAAQRNFSLAQCGHDWVLSLDADERVSLSLAREIAAHLSAAPSVGAYRVPALNRCLGRWLRHGGIYPGYRVRLFDRRRHAYEKGRSDARLDAPAGGVPTLGGPVLRLAYSSFQAALSRLNDDTDREAQVCRERGDRARPLGMLLRPWGRFFADFFIRRGFQDGLQGFLYCSLTALRSFSTSVKLWELQRGRN